MSDFDFDRMVLGGGDAAHAFTSPQGDDIPEFLRDDNTAAVSGGPASTAWLGDAGSHAPAGGSDEVVLSSAEAIDIETASGNRWVLAREKILGKGNFGCATLYSVRLPPSTLSTILPNSAAGGSNCVVVKDINLQTMSSKEEEMQCLAMEVKVLREVIHHPNFLQFYDYHEATAARMAYIITEYCAGGDLENSIIEKRKQVNEELVASVTIQLLTALYELHTTHRVIHRDIKPQNVFLLEDGISVRIGDFGISAQLGHGTGGEKLKAACGSPLYMAPELCEEKAYDMAVDVWSAGVVLYELMALEKPFNASTMPALVQLILSGSCVPLASRKDVSKKYSKELINIVQSLLTVNPVARPTLRRVLRNPYIVKYLYTVPRNILDSKAYRSIYGDEAVDAAVPMCVFPGVAASFARRTAAATSTRASSTSPRKSNVSPSAAVPAAGCSEDEYYEDDFEDE